jgi:hypothetical protein
MIEHYARDIKMPVIYMGQDYNRDKLDEQADKIIHAIPFPVEFICIEAPELLHKVAIHNAVTVSFLAFLARGQALVDELSFYPLLSQYQSM